MDKRGVSQIVTTILIILLVLAAIVIVWQAVKGTVTKGAGTIEEQSSCIGINLDVTEAKASDNKVKVTRLAGGPTEAVSVKLLVDGAIVTTTEATTLLELASTTYTISTTPDPLTAANQKVEVASVLSDTTVCDVSDSIDSIA